MGGARNISVTRHARITRNAFPEDLVQENEAMRLADLTVIFRTSLAFS
jgi:hypothetical protein